MWNKITNPLSSIKRHITSILGSRTSDSPSCKKILKNINTNIAKSRDTSRGNRGEIEGNPFWAHTSSSESVNKMTELQWYSGKELSVLKAKILRNKTISKFNVNPKIIKKLGSTKFNWINQGDVGGCSFACISNICQLANIPISWDISYLKTSSGFKNVYTNTFECDDEGYNQWISVISSDFCKKIPDFNKTLVKIQYVPIKIRGGVHNKNIGDGLDKEKYGQAVFDYIINLLDTGHVIGIPFLQHFITIIGHNGSQFLFLGSFGKKYDYGGLHIMRSEFSQVLVGDALNSCIFAKL